MAGASAGSGAGRVDPQYLGEIERLRKLSNDELGSEQAKFIEITARGLVQLALIAVVREERGENFDGLRIGVARWLRPIAEGKLLPELVARYAYSPRAIQRIHSLTIQEQRECETTGRLPPHILASPHRSVSPPRQRTTGSIEVFPDQGCIIVSGERVVITRDELVLYLSKLGAIRRSFMCAMCGQSVGATQPPRCTKCNSRSFEEESALLAVGDDPADPL